MDQYTAQTRVPGRYGLDEIAANRLQAWPNPTLERDYIVHMEIPEFTCLCPQSGFSETDEATIFCGYTLLTYMLHYP